MATGLIFWFVGHSRGVTALSGVYGTCRLSHVFRAHHGELPLVFEPHWDMSIGTNRETVSLYASFNRSSMALLNLLTLR